MKVFSTFSGIGGFELGAHAADSDTEFIGYSEIDKYAIKVYEKQFPGVPNYGDITKINAEELPDFDCLVGGFPCQAFSIAGKRKGFEDTRGTLFFDLARILRAKQPRLFVFENVKGLLSHDSGRTFKTIIEAIDELGYNCQWQVLNSKNHGVPQNRERVYIVGHLRGTPRPKVFPITGTKPASSIIRTIRTGGAGSYTEKHARDIIKVGTLRTHKDGQGFRENRQGISPTIPARARQDGSGQPVVKIREATIKGYAEATVGQSINLSNLNSKTRRGRVSDVAPTIETGMQVHTLTDDVRIRRLTPIECERLQAFPDNWTKYGKIECTAKDCSRCAILPEDDVHMVDVTISDTQRYKMCGNAVTTNVVQAIFERIL